MKVTTIGIDLAKSVFQLHGVDERGHTVVRKQLKRDQVMAFMVNIPPCLVGMEACGSAHHWARELTKLGHNVRLMAPQFVKPYVKSQKNDAADAEAICEAVGRPNMRFVSVKTLEQQAVLSLHRARQGFVRGRTAQANQIRGLMSEFGMIIPQGIGYVTKRVPQLLADVGDSLPGKFVELIRLLLGQLMQLDGLVDELERQINQWHRNNPASVKIAKVPGIGPITASALVASIGDARDFSGARQLSAWIGIVPQQHSSGGKQTLLGISKRGDCYLRTLLIHGARSVIRHAMSKPDEGSWLHGLLMRRNANVAAVALANKNARIVWALLAQGREFKAGYTRAEAGA